MIFFFNKIILSVFVMLVYFSLFGCRIFFVEGTISILLGVKSMPCIVQFEQESCDVVASRTKSLCKITATEYRCTASLYQKVKFILDYNKPAIYNLEDWAWSLYTDCLFM